MKFLNHNILIKRSNGFNMLELYSNEKEIEKNILANIY